MAHFAELNTDNVVLCVIVVAHEDILDPETGMESEVVAQAFLDCVPGLEGRIWKQCSYSGSFRGAYPGERWIYDPLNDVFLPPEEP